MVNIPPISTKQITTSHLKSLNTKNKQRPEHMTLEIHVLALDRPKNVAGLNRVVILVLQLLVTTINTI
jgi:hypothetical protein